MSDTPKVCEIHPHNFMPCPLCMIDRLVAQTRELTAENQQLKEKIVAAGYRPDSSADEIQRSREALDEMVKYQAGEMQAILPENERLRAALRPFADAHQEWEAYQVEIKSWGGNLKFGDIIPKDEETYRQAAQALEGVIVEREQEQNNV